MNALEWRATAGLAGLYSARLLGIFMVLPVLALYVRHMPGADGFHVGLALGIYGLTQACLQLPYGIASDKFGRKPLIVIGLIVFAAGSILAGLSESINGIIIGRALQGAGAIGAVSNALLSDLTRPEQRTKAMMILGVGIGFAFTFALILGPLLSGIFGVAGLFYLTAVMAVVSIGVLLVIVPAAPKLPEGPQGNRIQQIKSVLGNPDLLRMDVSIFLMHAVLTALFIGVPIALKDQIGMPQDHHWWIYLPVMLGSLAVSFPLIYVAEAKKKMRATFVSAVAILCLSNLLLIWAQASLVGIVVCLFLFFAAFNLMEAILPSLVSRYCAVEFRGAGMGVYSTCQFLGAFFGGALGGVAQQHLGASGLFLSAGLICIVWVLLSLGVRQPVASSKTQQAH